MTMHSRPTLIIGNKNYSSWSLRPWLLMRHFDVAFEEIQLPLDTPEFRHRIAAYSPTGRVPALIDGAVRVWDSLAICEYVNEKYLAGRGWPAAMSMRAQARAVSSEMHAGFAALRETLPMNCRKRVAGLALSDVVQKDIARIGEIWREPHADRADQTSLRPFLFGDFSIADAMYAPVVLRFISYGIALDARAQAYSAAILKLAAMQDWLAQAALEPLATEHERSVP